jgi:hypothetical protein
VCFVVRVFRSVDGCLLAGGLVCACVCVCAGDCAEVVGEVGIKW